MAFTFGPRRATYVDITESLKDQEPPDIWLRGYLQRKGWAQTDSHDADGPDGTMYALHKPGALCIVEGRWNHWDGEQGGHTEDPYAITVSCGGAELQRPVWKP